MSVLCTVCARGGSKGVPGKNIRMLQGKPLIAHTIEQALSCSLIDRVAVSTDSREIAHIAEKAGAEVPFLRPPALASDTSAKLPVIQHALAHYIDTLGYKPDYVIDLDPTSPLRINDDIEQCLGMVMNDADCGSVVTGYRSNKNPYFNMLEISWDGYARLSKGADMSIARRPGCPRGVCHERIDLCLESQCAA